MLEIFLEDNHWKDEKVPILSRKLSMVVHSSWEREAEAMSSTSHFIA